MLLKEIKQKKVAPPPTRRSTLPALGVGVCRRGSSAHAEIDHLRGHAKHHLAVIAHLR